MTETPSTLTHLRKSNLQSSYLEAALFSGAEISEISRLLDIPQEVILAYQEEYLLVSKGNKLEKLEYIEEEMSHKDSAIRRRGSLKLWALSSGLEFLKWRLGEAVQISPITGMQNLFSICFYKAKEAMYSSSTSDEGKESQKWIKLSTDIARLIKLWVSDSEAARKDIELALKEIIPEFGSIDEFIDKQDLG